MQFVEYVFILQFVEWIVELHRNLNSKYWQGKFSQVTVLLGQNQRAELTVLSKSFYTSMFIYLFVSK